MSAEYVYATTYSTFLFVVVMIIALVFGGGGALNVVEGGAWSMVRLIVSMLPYILLGLGLVLSFLTLQFRFLVPTLVGSGALVVSMLASFIFGKFLPMFVASTSAILTYYTYDYIVAHATENPMKNVLAAIWSFLVLLAQVLCTKPSPVGTYLFNQSLLNDGLAAVFGISIGLAGWITTSATDSNLLPYTGHHTPPPSLGSVKPSQSLTTGAPTL